MESDLSGSEFEADFADSDVNESDAELPLPTAAPSGKNSSRGRTTRAAKGTDFMQLDSDMDSELLDVDSDDVDGEDLALIAGAAENDDEEAEDLQAAIKASLSLTPSIASGRGKTGAPAASRATMAALRAAAAEKRAGTSQVVDDRDAWSSDEDVEGLMESGDLSSDDLDSDEDGKKRKKGKASAKKKRAGKGKAVTLNSTSKATSLSIKEMRAQRRAEKEEARRIAAPVKHEELKLRKELGRKLTHVMTIFLHHFQFFS